MSFDINVDVNHGTIVVARDEDYKGLIGFVSSLQVKSEETSSQLPHT